MVKKKLITKKLTKSTLLRQSQKEYMSLPQLEFFKDMLLLQKEEYTKAIEELRQEISQKREEYDNLDAAVNEEGTLVKLRIIERDSNLLNKINSALSRIENSSYGYCAKSGKPIGLKRLLLRPTTIYSIEAKMVEESEQKKYKN